MAVDAALLRLPENRVLLFCAGEAAHPDELALVLGEVADWSSLLLRLQNHRLLLLFWRRLVGREGPVPREILRDLEDRCEQALHQNLFLVAELQKVCAFLDEQGFRVLSYKGPSVALSAYKSLAARSFVDLDLLIGPSDRQKLVAALKPQGFKPIVTRTPLSPLIRRRPGDDYEVPLLSADGLSVLDVHWAIAAPFESFPLEFEGMWARRVAVASLNGVFTLCREDLIIALAFHGFKHLWQELEWLACLLALLLTGRDEPLNWERIETIARASDCARILGIALRLALDLSEVEGDKPSPLREIVPFSLWRSIEADASVEKLSRQVWQTILEPPDNKLSPLSHFARELAFGWRGRGRFKARRTFAWGLLRSFLLSLEKSKTVLALAAPFLRLFPRANKASFKP